MFKFFAKKNFYKFSHKNFSNLSTKGYFDSFLSKIKRTILKRIVIFRVMFYGSLVLILVTILRYSNNVNFGKNTTPSFFIRNKADLNIIYNVAGVIKPGSINFIKGTDECSFTLTDYEHDIKVFYKGPTTNSFLEGNTLIVSGCITDINKPDIFIATKIMTDHSYNSDKWLARRLEKRTLAEEEEIVYSMMKKIKI